MKFSVRSKTKYEILLQACCYLVCWSMLLITDQFVAKFCVQILSTAHLCPVCPVVFWSALATLTLRMLPDPLRD